MMTWAQIVAEVTSMIVRDDVGTRIPNWVKWAQFRIGIKWRHNELETTTTGSFTVGAPSITLPSNCIGIMSLRDTTANVRLLPRDITWMANLDLTKSGSPTLYSRFGAGLTLNCSPSAANAYQLWYYARPSSSDVSLNERWEEPLVLLSASIGYAAILEPERAGYYENLFIACVKMIPEAVELDSKSWDFPVEVDLQ